MVSNELQGDPKLLRGQLSVEHGARRGALGVVIRQRGLRLLRRPQLGHQLNVVPIIPHFESFVVKFNGVLTLELDVECGVDRSEGVVATRADN